VSTYEADDQRLASLEKMRLSRRALDENFVLGRKPRDRLELRAMKRMLPSSRFGRLRCPWGRRIVAVGVEVSVGALSWQGSRGAAAE
jgi:hypothetical protein